MHFLWTSDVNSAVYKEALAIRKKVFIEEQHVPEEIEVDDLEDKTEHIVGYSNNLPVAAARVLPIYGNAWKIQRVAVLNHYRGRRIGQKMMLEIETCALNKELSELVLGAQDHAIDFYTKLGFVIEGKGYQDAGIPHHTMKKKLIRS